MLVLSVRECDAHWPFENVVSLNVTDLFCLQIKQQGNQVRRVAGRIAFMIAGSTNMSSIYDYGYRSSIIAFPSCVDSQSL